jgi:hypothetical protein
MHPHGTTLSSGNEGCGRNPRPVIHAVNRLGFSGNERHHYSHGILVISNSSVAPDTF